ncbi:MAG: type I restriction endonuclease [Rickettsia endosymbiont of Ixodes persulcatus]|nr:type I restriction endonuclease [Rickettsia endosymbiont of Ixodes persulcatus]MCZ6903711.1 type I restriction endonuclease [Rickettsia endosymbiont of Ixodes persulcatus]MCZ6909009.1 type I restriction endonuclease [Rickettsia endosymbiont of Ixodes persulcatus]MCZ6909791.1 type I restriction endonuclease [Rickettsia endosymbiont of Ixodes persulcatus]MCZ6914180.1 type I restriction endonuclease [Rickettsia endosymbiont of Ixodes persulcatus]
MLENILIEKILKFNNKFNSRDAKEAVRQLSDIKNCGLIKTNQEIYDLLTLGATIKKDKSYTLQYIDWQEPRNNIYHVAFEMLIESKYVEIVYVYVILYYSLTIYLL